MENDLITIIVPVYKVEKYLAKCIENIINQSYANLEIILIDDGSPDNCGEMCDNYAREDKRIKVIHKENGGLSDARNRAIDITTGKYILLVDSDDYLEKNAVEYLSNVANKYNADIVIGQSNLVYEGKEGKKVKVYSDFTREDSQEEIYNAEQALEMMLYNSKFTNNALNKLYRTTLFEDIRYPVGKLYEDLATTYKLISKSEKIVLGKKITYNYLTDRNDSIMNKKFDLRRMQGLEFTEEILDFVKKYYPNIEKSAISRLYMECIFILLKIPFGKKYKEQNRKLRQYLRKYRITVTTNKKMPKKQKMLCIVTIFGRIPLRIIWSLKEGIKKKKGK